jgi:hypothetical protein
MGSICERCGAAQHTFARVMHQSLTGEKKNLDDFYRVAGGNKPMPYDKRPAEEPQFHTEITTPNQETHIPI